MSGFVFAALCNAMITATNIIILKRVLTKFTLLAVGHDITDHVR